MYNVRARICTLFLPDKVIHSVARSRSNDSISGSEYFAKRSQGVVVKVPEARILRRGKRNGIAIRKLARLRTCTRINKDENTIDLLSRKQRSRNGQTYDPIRKLEKEFNIPYNFFSPLRSSLRETIKINLQLFFHAFVKYLDRSERNEKLSKEERREVNIEGDPVTFLSLSVP